MSKRTLDPIALLTSIPFKPERIHLKDHSFLCMRVRIPLPSIDPLEWLAAQSLFPKIYFNPSSEEGEVAAVGAAYSLDIPPIFLSQSASMRFYGGMDFQKRTKKTWGTFPSSRFVLPLLEIEKTKEMTYLSLNRTSDAPLSDVHLETTSLSIDFQKPLGKIHAPSFPVWKRLLEEIKQSQFPKVVLSRATLLSYENPLSYLSYCKALRAKNQACSLFAFAFSPDEAFIGATPESLYCRIDKTLKTSAIAGTRMRGKTASDDERLKETLLNSKKDQLECLFVKEHLKTALFKVCSSLSFSPHFEVIQTSQVQHLSIPFEGTLKTTTCDTDLISILHPTPAVAGVPVKEALELIQKKEPFDRGWYAAPVGYISKEKAHLLVAIRSALFKDRELRLFAGAGIVEGSHFSKEWEELDSKISQYIDLVGEKNERSHR